MQSCRQDRGFMEILTGLCKADSVVADVGSKPRTIVHLYQRHAGYIEDFRSLSKDATALSNGAPALAALAQPCQSRRSFVSRRDGID